MINFKQELQNYPSINLKGIGENESEIPDNIKNSVILYNKALNSLKSDSEDIAIIELKKAISLNSHFYEAMNLLGVCYSYTKEYSKAGELFEKVIAAENNSIKAQKYLDLLNSGAVVISASEGKSKGLKKDKTKNAGDRKLFSIFDSVLGLKKNWKDDFRKYTLGILFGGLVVFLIFILVNPQINSTKSISNSGDETKKDSTVVAKKSGVVEEKLKKAQDDLKTLNSQMDYYKSALKLFEVEKLVDNQEYEAAADLLVPLKLTNFEGFEKERYTGIFNLVMPKVQSALINEGGKLLDTKKYQEALDKLNKLQSYGNNLPNSDLVLYWIGKCYIGLGDSNNAIQTYQKLINAYPNSKYSVYAQNKINQLNNL